MSITLDVTAMFPQPPADDGWAMFNVDGLLVERVRRYHEQHAFTCAVETGTFKGMTTVGLAKMFPRVFTIEVNDEFYRDVAPKLAPYPNVTALSGNSAEVLQQILPQLSYPLFAYLDAHWGDYCPLRDELAMLLTIKQPKLIMIHDFQVPGRSFGYDEYNGHPNNLDYLADLLPHDECRYAFNHATTQGSADRGVLFIEHLL